MLVPLKYAMETSLVLMIPSSGQRATGIRAVAAMGRRSNIQ